MEMFKTSIAIPAKLNSESSKDSEDFTGVNIQEVVGIVRDLLSQYIQDELLIEQLCEDLEVTLYDYHQSFAI